jgi:iron complex outermembrane recepter protein
MDSSEPAGCWSARNKIEPINLERELNGMQELSFLKGGARFAQSRLRSTLLAASGIALLVTAQGAFAQDQAAAEDSSGLGEIIVTAQKRAESVQDVPIAITAFGSDSIEDRQIDGIADLVKLVPSMYVGQNYGANTFTIRGVSTGLTSGAEDPSIAVHINGVYQPRSRSIDVATMDLERIEVLSGPQGTLYGRNATGGVINYITKGPTKDFEAGVTAFIGNYDRHGVKGYVSGPLSDTIGIRISGLWDDQNKGFIRNLLPGAPNKTIGGADTLGGHVVLEFNPSSTAKFVVDGIYSRTNSSTIFNALGPPNAGAPVAALLGRQSFKPHEVYSSYPASFDSKYFQTSLTGSIDLSDNVQLKSITAYQGYNDNMRLDGIGSEILAVAVNQVDRSRTFTQELNLTTKAFDNKLTSVFGFFYYHDKLTVDTGVPFAIAGPGNYYVYGTQQTSKSYAFFTDQTLAVTDRLRLLAGVRYNHDSKRVGNQLSIQNDEFSTPYFDVCDTSNRKSWNSWTPKVGVQYDVADGVMAYGGWQKGFKSGGYASNTCGNGYDPESIKGPEIGLKSTLFDNRLRLNIAAYYYKYSNLQVQKLAGLADFRVVNAAAATLKGIEVSAVGKLTNHFSLDLTMNVQSAKYDEFEDCNSTLFPGACTAPGSATDRVGTTVGGILVTPGNGLSNLAGHDLNRAPPYTINLGAEYLFDIGGGNLLFRAESYWSGKVFFDPYATLVQMQQPAYNLQNLFLTYTPAGDRFKIRAFVKNVGKTDYKSAAFFNSSVGEPSGSWASPRTFGAEISAKF